MTVALDVGAHRIRSLRRDEDRLLALSCRALYAVLPDSASQRDLLEQARISYAVCEEDLVLMGDGAEEFARLFHAPTAPLFPDGRVPAGDPPARQIVAAFVEALLPPSGSAENVCCLTVPGGGSDAPGDDAEWQFLSRLVKLRGYTPVLLSSAMAVVLAELADRAFTGIAIDFGAAKTELAVAHCGVQLARCGLARGGQWIDRELATRAERFAWDPAGNRYLDVEAVRRWKEQATLRPSAAAENGLLIELYEDLVNAALAEAARAFAGTLDCRRIPQPLPVVCSGGPARIPGFAPLLEQAWRRASIPVESDRIRIAAEDEYRTPRGCLIRAELETQPDGILSEVA
ncbi:MAG: hypothetical protein WD069_17275 [Planctomycetales bacterium]